MGYFYFLLGVAVQRQRVSRLLPVCVTFRRILNFFTTLACDATTLPASFRTALRKPANSFQLLIVSRS
jgi:hypothetical protein